MAITSASFVPESRKGGGAAAGAGNGHGHNGAPVDGAYNEATDSATPPAAHESVPAAHPVTGTPLPKSTGAGKGNIHRGGRHGR